MLINLVGGDKMQKLNSELFEEIVYDEGEPCVVVFPGKLATFVRRLNQWWRKSLLNTGEKSLYYVDVEEEKGLFKNSL